MGDTEKVEDSRFKKEVLEKLTNEITRLHRKLDNSDAAGEFDEINCRIKGLDFAKSIIFSTNNNKNNDLIVLNEWE